MEQIKFLEDQQCAVLCQLTYSEEDVESLEEKIKDAYRVNWILDNLPVTSESARGSLVVGFPLGSINPDVEMVPSLHNHVKIRIGYNNANTDSEDEGRIVDFNVVPYSFQYTEDNYDKEQNQMKECEYSATMRTPMYLSKAKDGQLKVYWTYSVEWILDNEREWRTRWDIYFEAGSGSDEVHWFSIINALVIVLFLSGMVGMILMRSLHRDISRYNRVPTEEERAEEREESGWKLVHADVFRPPSKNPMLFCVMLGTGTQLLGMALVTLFFAAVGVLRPSNRGKLIIALLVCFVLLGMLAGFVSARTYKMFKGKRWQLCTVLTGMLFPGILFALFFFLNLFVWGAGSDAAVPFGSILLVFFLWTFISVPLVFAGAFFGFRCVVCCFRLPRFCVCSHRIGCVWPLQTTPNRVPGGDEQHPASSAAAAVVHDEFDGRGCRRRTAVRRHFRGTFLRAVVAVDRQVLLRVRVPAAGVHHPHQHVRGDHDRAHVLPAVL